MRMVKVPIKYNISDMKNNTTFKRPYLTDTATMIKLIFL